MNVLVATLVGATLGAADGGQAMAQDRIGVGDRVRGIAAPEHGGPGQVRFDGKIREVDGPYIVVPDKWGLEQTIRVSTVTQLEIGTKGSNIGKGDLIGGLVGLVIGSASTQGKKYGPAGRAQAASDAGFGLVLGVGIGALVGAASPNVTWHSVPIDELRVTWLPDADHRFTASVSATF